MSESFDFPEVDWLIVGALGEPGKRLFVLQAVRDNEPVTLRIEKQQALALAEYISGLLTELPMPTSSPTFELMEFTATAWSVGSIGVGYDDVTDRVVIECHELDSEENETSDLASARFALTREQAVDTAIGAVEVAESGRPRCPLCGYPLDPEGHVCPRTNGHDAPKL